MIAIGELWKLQLISSLKALTAYPFEFYVEIDQFSYEDSCLSFRISWKIDQFTESQWLI